jgi:predicted Zn-dependent protease
MTLRTAYRLLAVACVLAAGCQALRQVTEVATEIGVATGKISREEADSVNRVADAAGKAFERLTPEQEYYIGRAVAASVLQQFKPYDNSAANAYINLVGQALAMASDRPETFGGYHFLILDTDDINAFAAPGGLVMITRGLLRCCAGEDAVAAVLAHEIAHVQHQHGLQAINKSRLTSALTILAAESAKQLGSEQLAELTASFEGSINDIMGTMVNSGYARRFETQSDRSAVAIMQRVGYDPHALVDMLAVMQKQLKPGGLDFAKTHPDPGVRIRDVRPAIGALPRRTIPEARRARFQAALGGI